MDDDTGTLTFTCVRDKHQVMVQCDDDASLDEVIELFKGWLLAVGYHPDSVAKELP